MTISLAVIFLGDGFMQVAIFLIRLLSIPLIVVGQLSAQPLEIWRASATPPQGELLLRMYLSADGRYLVYTGSSPGTDEYGGPLQTYRFDRVEGTRQVLSKTSNGDDGKGDSHARGFSRDGRFVLVYTYADNLAPGIPEEDDAHLVLIDTQGGAVPIRPSLIPAGGHVYYGDALLTGDGSKVFFISTTCSKFFSCSASAHLFDRTTGVSTLLSAIAPEGLPSLLATTIAGDYLVFALSIEPEQNSGGLLRLRLSDQSIARIDVSSIGLGGNTRVFDAAISDDGQTVLYTSGSDNLVSEDSNMVGDTFLTDLSSGEPKTSRVSLTSSGQQSLGGCYGTALSADGRVAAFACIGGLIQGDSNASQDVYVLDRSNGGLKIVSQSATGSEGNLPSNRPAISADGAYVAFISGASNLVLPPTQGQSEAYLARVGPVIRDWCPTDPLKLVPGSCGCGQVEIDSDKNGVADCVQVDQCPLDANKLSFGKCGCGIQDVDKNGNGIVDCLEPDSTAVPEVADVQVSKKVIRVQFEDFGVQTVYRVLLRLGKKIVREDNAGAAQFVYRGLPKGRYRLSYAVVLANGQRTQESPDVQFRIR